MGLVVGAEVRRVVVAEEGGDVVDADGAKTMRYCMVKSVARLVEGMTRLATSSSLRYQQTRRVKDSISTSNPQRVGALFKPLSFGTGPLVSIFFHTCILT
jgi:hypothetical protein